MLGTSLVQMTRKRGRPSSQPSLRPPGSGLPVINPPTQACGKLVSVPGSWWKWGDLDEAAENGSKTVVCIVHDFDAIHKFGSDKKAAYQIEVTDADGGGTGEMHWMASPMSFLKHYYAHNPLPGQPETPQQPQTSQQPQGSDLLASPELAGAAAESGQLIESHGE